VQGTAVLLAWAIDHELAEDGADRDNRCAASYSLGENVTTAESAFGAVEVMDQARAPRGMCGCGLA
jgi:hypothetical protein